MKFDLSKIATPDLRVLADRLRLVGSYTPADIAAWGLADLELPEAPAALLSAAAEAALAERKRIEPEVELIWTGPEAAASAARDTAVVVRSLLASAAQSVLIAGFRFDHANSILQPLHEAVEARGVNALFFVDVPDAMDIDEVIRDCWPFAGRTPRFYRDARRSRGASLHAKCVVVDHERTLVTSANFTRRGQDRNIEVGVLVRSAAFARALERQWLSAIDDGVFVRAL